MAFVPAIPSAPSKNVNATCEDDLVKPVPEVPVQLNLQVSTSTKQCTVRWGQNDENNFFNCQVKVSVYKAYSQIIDDQQNWSIISCLKSEILPFGELEYSWHSLPREHYYVTVEAQDQNDNHKVVARGNCRTRACYSKTELQMLYQMAVNYSVSMMREIHEVYRCKPLHYWENIFNLDGIMRPYMKDENGHGENHINSTLKGLFFSAQLNKNGTKRTASYFGDTKYSLHPHEIFHPSMVNFYFCDFYCNQTRKLNKNHYVTIVVCKKNSKSDLFCANVLIPLPTPNPLFNVQLRTNGVTYHLNLNVCVEFFYTEDVPLSIHKLALIKGRGQSTPGGLPNDETCILCNLFY